MSYLLRVPNLRRWLRHGLGTSTARLRQLMTLDLLQLGRNASCLTNATTIQMKPLRTPPVHPMPHPTAARVKKRIRSAKSGYIPCRLTTDCIMIAGFVNMKPLPPHLCYRHRPHPWFTEQRRTIWWSTYFPTCVWRSLSSPMPSSSEARRTSCPTWTRGRWRKSHTWMTLAGTCASRRWAVNYVRLMVERLAA